MASTSIFSSRVELPVSAMDAFAWHTRKGALERLTPPWEPARVLQHDGVHDGARTILEVALGPTHQRWIAEHSEVVPGKGFVDEQVEGPFSRWRHTHRFVELGEARCALEDHIEYRLPFGGLGRFFGGGYTEGRLARMFAYRHAVLLDDLRRHAAYPGKRLRVAITGQSGMLGRSLTAMLVTGGHEVLPVVRRAPLAGEIAWDPQAGTIEREKLVGVDAVVHLAGDNIAEGRWTDEKKARVRDSRVQGTTLIAETLARLEGGPKVLVSASAIGWYGDRPELVDEASAPGKGFLPEVCELWERSADPARAAGLRVVHPRIGIVLSLEGGALAKLSAAFSAGIGGRVGKGDQGMSWIALDDVVGALHAALLDPMLEGPVNLTAPYPVDNVTFVRTLGDVMHRPSALPLPGAAVKLMFGEMGERLLLDGAFVKPSQLEASRHRFSYPELDGALRHLLGRHERAGQN